MKKFLTKSIRIAQRSSANVVAVAVPPLAAVLSDVKSAFFGLCVNAGKQVLASMMEADRVALCGPKGRPDPDRRALRGGHTRSWLTLGGTARADGPAARSLGCGRGAFFAELWLGRELRSAERSDACGDCSRSVHAQL